MFRPLSHLLVAVPVIAFFCIGLARCVSASDAPTSESPEQWKVDGFPGFDAEAREVLAEAFRLRREVMQSGRKVGFRDVFNKVFHAFQQEVPPGVDVYAYTTKFLAQDDCPDDVIIAGIASRDEQHALHLYPDGTIRYHRASGFWKKLTSGGSVLVRVLARLVGVGLIVLGILAVVSMVRKVAKVRAMVHWPTVEGEVLHSEVVTWAALEGGPCCRPDIRYRYEIDGCRYVGSDIATDLKSSSRRYAERMVAERPVGGMTTVYYDPDEPKTCYLEVRFPFVYLLLPLVASFPCGMGIFLLLVDMEVLFGAS